MAEFLGSTAGLWPLASSTSPSSSRPLLPPGQARAGHRLREGLLSNGRQQHGLDKTRDDACGLALCRQRLSQSSACSALPRSSHSRTAFTWDERPSDRVLPRAAGGGQGSPLDTRTAEPSPDSRESDPEGTESEDEESEVANSSVPILGVDGYNEWHHISHPPPYTPPSQGSDPRSKPIQRRDRRPCSSTPLTASSSTEVTESSTAQVLTEEEQRELAATPTHPGALKAMYWTYVACCLGEKVWRFGLPAILSLMLTSMQPIAVLSFTSQLIIFLAAPWVGSFMDSTPRVTAFNTLCMVQTGAMIVSALATLYGLTHVAAEPVLGLSLLREPWFLAVMVSGAVDKLTGLASGVAFERDWVIQLAGRSRPMALASANAILRRVDLFCELAGPISFGWLLSRCKPLFCVQTALALSILSLPIMLLLVQTTDRLSKGALRRPRVRATPGISSSSNSSSNGATTLTDASQTQPPNRTALTSQGPQEQTPGSSLANQAHSQVQTKGQGQGQGPLEAALKGWRSFLSQPVLPASLAYVLLYFNAVLSPGGLMTSFLTQRGVDVSVIGAFRGACAAMGFAATFISAPLVARLGVLRAGAVSLTFQATLLALAVAVFFVSPLHHSWLLYLFLALVVFSRLGTWVYDVVDAQIFQTAVPTAEANLVGTTEMALASLAELFMLGVAIVLHDVSSFGQLALLSMSSVVAAAAIYIAWLARPDPRRSALFPRQPRWLALEGEEGPQGPAKKG